MSNETLLEEIFMIGLLFDRIEKCANSGENGHTPREMLNTPAFQEEYFAGNVDVFNQVADLCYTV